MIGSRPLLSSESMLNNPDVVISLLRKPETSTSQATRVQAIGEDEIKIRKGLGITEGMYLQLS